MNDEAESSRAPRRQDDAASHLARLEDALARFEEAEQRDKEKAAKQRRLDAKRKRIQMLGELLRDLDMVVYLQLITLYYFDCSFFWLLFKAFTHGFLLTPIPDTATVTRPPDEPRPFLPLLLFSFAANFLLHLTYPAPSAGEDTRGYLHGGLMIDFIGQQGPTSKWKLGALDMCILFLQLVMVSVHVKRRELKKKLAKLSAGGGASSTTTTNTNTTTRTTSDSAPAATNDNAARDQDADDEERGVLHRTDTLSDFGIDPDNEEDALLPSPESGHMDAVELLSSGQCVIGDFTLIDTLLQENRDYSAYRLTHTESGNNDMPETLRRLNTLRTRFGVGGG
ncbi:hypothetical protein ACET3X_005039 [Alternaria dauci]|uniref:DUF1746 domain-containing protein n=1 Tax=Alternaria dauci TaxID=48095 RepID=A0ABR3UKX5_9PLEO